MAQAVRRVLERLEKFRIQLRRKLKLDEKEKNEPRRNVDVYALAVRDTIHSCDEGLYCSLKYGSARAKTPALRKNTAAEWKDHIALSTYSSGDLFIEVWKKRSGRLKKFVGQIRLAQQQLEEAPSGKLREWFPLHGKGKRRDVVCGKLFVSLSVPSLAPVEQQREIQVNVARQEEQPLLDRRARPDANGVVDRLHELRCVGVPPVHGPEVCLDQFGKRTADVERLIKDVDAQIALLQTKLKMLERRGTNTFLASEVERLVDEIEQALEVGTKKLKLIGGHLDAKNDVDLKAKMSHFNTVLYQLMERTERFNSISEDVPRRVPL
jgi:hypothetical protein